MTSTEKSADPAAVARISLGVLIAIGLLRTLALALTNGISFLGFSLAGSTRPLTLALAGTKVWIIAVDVLTVLLVIKLLARENTTLAPLLTPRPVGKNLIKALVALVIVYIAFVFGSYAGNLLIYYGSRTIPESVAPPVWVGLLRLFIVPITVTVAEETLYRGYLLPRLQVHLGRVGAVIVSALLAAAQNFAFGMGNLETAMAGFVGSFIVGLAFGALYLWFKRLAPLILVHWLFEAIVGLSILTAALQR
jgi:uncharacterized protein